MCPYQKRVSNRLEFWRLNLIGMNQASMFECYNLSMIVYSDGSKAGFGGYEVSTVNSIAHGQWTAEESVQSSTWRELVAVYRVF